MARPTKYPPEFRREAVELVFSAGRSGAEVARSLGMSDKTLWNWVNLEREERERRRRRPGDEGNCELMTKDRDLYVLSHRTWTDPNESELFRTSLKVTE